MKSLLAELNMRYFNSANRLSIYILRLSLYILSLRIENFTRNDRLLFASFVTKKRPVKMYSTSTGRYSYIMVLLFFTETFSLFFN